MTKSALCSIASPWRLGVLAVFLLFAVAPPARAQERIEWFDASIVVDADGSFTVTETIVVWAEGREIQRGIFRDLPTHYAGGTVVVPFEVVSVTRDGAREPYHTKRGKQGLRVYIGSPGRTLRPGRYVYELTYRTDYQLGHYDAHDELYWNVTGQRWVFPIERASATVTLPDSVPFGEVDAVAYAGRYGSTQRDDVVASVDPQGRTVRFETTRALRPGEGVTVAVKWPKGHVAEKSAWSLLWRSPMVWLALGGPAAVMAYLFGAWAVAGRDPARGVVIPRFDSPRGLSAAGTRFVWRMGYDTGCLTAAIVGLAAKGRLRIRKGATWKLERTTTRGGVGPSRVEPLPGAERVVFDGLMRSENTLRLASENHARVNRTIESLRERLYEDWQDGVFRRNQGWLVPGWLLTGLLVLAMVFSAISRFGSEAQLMTGALGAAAMVALAIGLNKVVARALWGGWREVGWLGVGCALLMVGVAWLWAFAFGSVWLASAAAALSALTLGVNMLFVHLIKRPTVYGQQVRDEIDGFRMYLQAADRTELAALSPESIPEDTPERFERMLPYAMALGVADAWGKRFEPVLEAAARAAGAGDGGYRMDWYLGDSLDFHRMGWTLGSLGDGLTQSVSTAMSPPGNTGGEGFGGGGGGFGGGGFSGGGGGGGGGGGW